LNDAKSNFEKDLGNQSSIICDAIAKYKSEILGQLNDENQPTQPLDENT
jgi:hypothetical protein